MVDENYSIFTTATLKQGFYDPDQAENHTKEREKERKRAEETNITRKYNQQYSTFILRTKTYVLNDKLNEAQSVVLKKST